MKKFTKLWQLVMVLLFIPFTMNAQITIGTGTAVGQALPIEPFYGYTYSEVIYLAADINASGTITTLDWYFAGTSLSVSNDWTIYMGHTTKSAFTSTTDWITSAGMTQVWSGTFTDPGGPGWIQFDITDFAYNGTDNLVIAVDENAAGYNGSGDDFYCSATSGVQGIVYRADGTNPDPAAPPTATYLRNYIANIILGGIQQSCPPPTDPVATNITTSSADLAWTSNSGLSDIIYGPAGFDPLVSGSYVIGETSPYTLGGLTSATSYDFYVRDDCGGGDYSSWTGPTTFTTLCVPFAAPFSENFDGVTAPDLPVCWTGVVDNTTNTFASVGTYSSTTAPSQPNHIRWYNSGADTAGLYLISPQLASAKGLLADKRIKFQAYKSSTAGQLIIGTMSDPGDMGTFEPYDTVDLTTSYAEYTVNFDSYAGDDDYIALKPILTGTYQYFYMDDFIYEEIPSCLEPTQLTVDNITLTGADFAWTEQGTATYWDLYIVPAGSPAPVPGSTPTVDDVTSNPYTWTGGTHSTAYDSYVRADCGQNNIDVSPWSASPVSFTTLCGVFATPFTETFDNNTTPICWTNTALTGGPWYFGQAGSAGYGASGADDHTGNGGYFIWVDFSGTDDSVVMETPEIDVSTLTTPYLQFYFFSNNTDDASLNLLYVEAWDGAAWVQVDMISENTGNWKKFGYDMSAFTYGTNLVKFRFRGESGGSSTDYYNDLLVDDVSLIETPSCFEPEGLFAGSLFYNGATLRWYRHSGQTEAKWEACWGLPGTIVPGDAATYVGSGIHAPFFVTEPLAYEITGLTPTTTYEWYVRSICGVGDTSLWSESSSFTTLDVPGVLEGYVTEFVGDGPIQNALVTVDTLFALSDATGFYQIDSIQPGTYTVFCEADGYISVDSTGVVMVSNDTTHMNFELKYAVFNVDPASFSESLNPFEQLPSSFDIINTGNGDLNYSTDLEFLTDQILTIYDGPTSASPFAETNEVVYEPYSTADATWDLQFAYDVDTPSGLTGLAGSETDGTYLYATKWSGSEIVKFDLAGNFIETFTITGVTGLRDLTYDGQYFYGSNASSYIWEMDFTTKTLVSTITTPNAVRAIAYDSDNDGFWYNNWSTDLELVNRNGIVMNTITAPPSMYGCAYDNISAGGPFLWIFTGTTSGAGCQVEQYDLNTLLLTGLTHSVSGDLGADYIAGGLWLQPNVVKGTYTLGGLAQGAPDLVFGYELGFYESWVYITSNGVGVVPPGDTATVGIQFDSDHYWDVTKTGNIVVTHNGQVAKTVSSIPATLVVGPAIAPPDPPSDPSPVDGALLVSNLPTLEWTNNYVVEDCDLEWREVGGTITTINGLDDSYTFTTPLNDATQYEWRVTSNNSIGSTSGPWWTFTTIGFGTISGTVYYENGTDALIGLEGVAVECGGVYDTTAVDGTYSLVDIPEGTHTFTATKDGYENYMTEITVNPGDLITEDFEMLFGFPPDGLVTTSWDGAVDLNWNEPTNMYQISYDDGIATAWYWYGDPSSTQHMFYVRFTAPEDGIIQQFTLLNAADVSTDWNAIIICPDNGAGAPDLANPYQTFASVNVNSTIGAGGEWETLVLSTPFTVTTGQDFYLVTNWPDGSTTGPFVGTDESAPDSRSAYSADAGATWTIFGGGDWISRAYYTTAKAGNFTLKVIPQKNPSNVSLPVVTLSAKDKFSKGKDILPGQIAQSYVVPKIVIEGQSSGKALLGYKVYRGTDPAALTYLADAPDTTYTDNTVTNGVTYYYAVTAIQDEGQSPQSNISEAHPVAAAALPYFSNFDSDNGGFYTYSGSDWEWGVPTDPNGPAAAFSSPNVWGTKLDTNYSSPSNSWLINAFDLSAKGDYQVEFMRWFDLEAGWDYGYVAVDHDNDGNYTVIKVLNGTDTTWVKDFAKIPDSLTSAYCKIAFILQADGIYDFTGLYIDDVAVVTYVPPVATFDPLSFDLTIAQEGSATTNLAVGNTGGFPLEYSAVISNYSDAVLLTENFDAGIPGTWTVVDGGTTADTWTGVTDYSGNTLDGTPFAFVDSDGAGSGNTLVEELISPAFDASTYMSVILEFDQFYNHLSSIAEVLVWDGTAWQSVLLQNTADVGSWAAPDHQVIDISAYANAAMQVKFYYNDNGSWAWYWAVDNVVINGITAPTGWLTIDGGLTTSGSVTVGGDPTDILVGFDATGIPLGDWNADIVFTTNEEGAKATKVVSAVMHVVPGYDVTGTLTYANSANTPMDFVDVKLMNGAYDMGTVVTGLAGEFTFTPVADGSYTLEATTTKQAGSVTSADLSFINQYLLLTGSLNPLQKLAADVNWDGPGNVTSQDLSTINQYLLLQIGFGDWVAPAYVFEDGAFTVSGSNVTNADFQSLCSGDVNGSLIPPTFCPVPTELAAVNVTANSADLEWTSYSGLSNVEWGPAGFTQGTGTMLTGVTSPVSLTGLDILTSYDFYVMDDCGGLSQSAWVGPVSFTTLYDYCVAGPSSTYDSNVEQVDITGDGASFISHSGCGSGVGGGGYTGTENLRALSVDVTVGNSYSLAVTFGTCGGSYGGAGEVWIDWNQNNLFDAGESIGSSSGTPGTAPWDAPVTFNFTVPAGAVGGTTVMRVMQWEGGTLPLDACGTYSWGSVMDFSVNVTP